MGKLRLDARSGNDERFEPPYVPPIAGNPLPVGGQCFKRALDVTVAGLALVLLAPLVLLVAVAIRLDSPGRAIFRQTRVGSGGKRFVLYKFRTMTLGNDDSRHQAYVAALIRGVAEPNDGMFKLVGDRRITRFGRILRRFSLDEVPQLWNVLRGDMSLVGPRPPLPGEVALYDARSRERLRIKPGITGLWQVSGRCLLTFERMVELDTEYWRSWTPWLDLQIIARTPWAMLTGRGAS